MTYAINNIKSLNCKQETIILQLVIYNKKIKFKLLKYFFKGINIFTL